MKFNPPLGHLPALQYLLPAQLQIDGEYQRSPGDGASQTLIRKIAQHWNWDLCQPLVVARREDGGLFVIDGQHRLAAARLRGDIAQLPAVVVQYSSREDEAASFVHLNQQRKPLSVLDLFRAALTSGDEAALAIMAALTDAGLELAPHTNSKRWKPGMVGNIGGIQKAWQSDGAAVVKCAMRALAQAFGGQVLSYAGTLFPGIVAVCGHEIRAKGRFEEARFEKFVTMLAIKGQTRWRDEVAQARLEDPGMQYGAAARMVLRGAWAKATGEAAPVRARTVQSNRAQQPLQPILSQGADGLRWCEQCERRKSASAIAACESRFCSAKAAA
ncbi:MAG: DUF6551 family protein [Pseudomonadota bacterium]